MSESEYDDGNRFHKANILNCHSDPTLGKRTQNLVILAPETNFLSQQELRNCFYSGYELIEIQDMSDLQISCKAAR